MLIEDETSLSQFSAPPQLPTAVLDRLRLRANHLKVLADGVILRSEACLVRSLKERSAADAALAAEISAAIVRSRRG